MKDIKIGFIGFGEAAPVLAGALAREGTRITAYDILLQTNNGDEILKRRSNGSNIHFLPLKEVVTSSDYILSTVTTQAAKDVAQECIQYLRPGQIYLDLNSMAPSKKIEISNIISESGADFVEGAILGAIGVTGGKTHILTGGIRGAETARLLSDLGLNVSFYREEIGKASMFKMLRSIFSKGMEALLLEMLTAGKRAGIADDLWADINELLNGRPFEQTASNWIKTHPAACKRRYYEMVQVTETVHELGIEPFMSTGTRAMFESSMLLGFDKVFSEKPDSIEEVIAFMEAASKNIGKRNEYEENNSTEKVD